MPDYAVRRCSTCNCTDETQFYAYKPGQCRPCIRKRQRPISKARREDPRIILLDHARDRAKKMGLPFNLKIEDIPDIPDVCPVRGVPLRRRKGVPCRESP